MAHAYPYSRLKSDLLAPAAGKAAHDFFVDWQPLDSLDTPLLCAELVRLAYAPVDVVRAALPRAGLALAPDGWIGGEHLGERQRSRGSDGFVAHAADGSFTVLALRGTEPDKPEDLLADLDARPVPCGLAPGQVHAGFLGAYLAVRAPLRGVLDGLPAGARLIVTGHSLGAAVATLAAADQVTTRGPAGCELVTFGSPRVGDATFAAHLTAKRAVHQADPHAAPHAVPHAAPHADLVTRRVVHCADVVTRVPPERFDHDAVADLLAGFLPESWWRDRLADTLGAVAEGVLGHPGFVHVGELLYIGGNDAVWPGSPTAQACQRDRELARASYGQPADAALPAWQLPDPRAGLAALLRAAMARHEAASQDVAWRDLADHAPINYLGPLARRTRP